jgi:hypothetical protein
MNRHKMNLFKASYVDYKKGRPNSNVDSRRQDISTDYGDNAGDQTKGYVGNEQVDATAFQESMKNLDFTEANQEVANTEGMERRALTAARDLNGKSLFVGTHQFRILEPDDMEAVQNLLMEKGITNIPEAQDLGNGKKGWVIGGHKTPIEGKSDALQVKYFEIADTQATKELLNPGENRKWYKSDFSPEGSKVEHKGKTDTEFIVDQIEQAENFRSNQEKHPLVYPKVTDQYADGTLNSNSLNTSSLKHGGATNYKTDFGGMDAARDNIIPKKYFIKNSPELKRDAEERSQDINTLLNRRENHRHSQNTGNN